MGCSVSYRALFFSGGAWSYLGSVPIKLVSAGAYSFFSSFLFLAVYSLALASVTILIARSKLKAIALSGLLTTCSIISLSWASYSSLAVAFVGLFTTRLRRFISCAILSGLEVSEYSSGGEGVGGAFGFLLLIPGAVETYSGYCGSVGPAWSCSI